MTTFVGEAGVTIFQAVTLASALRLYAKTGMKPNRAYTPARMLATANELTGHNYRRGQYEAAAAALVELAERLRRENPDCIRS